MIYEPSIADRLLGCLIKDTTLANNDKYNLEKEDFIPQIHRIVFGTLKSLAQDGVKKARLVDIDTFLQQWQSYYNIFNDNGGKEYCETIYQLSELDNFDYYYNKLKKLSCIRSLQDNKFDISEFWDIDKSDEYNLSNVEKYEVDEILKYYESKSVDIRKKFSKNSNIEEVKLGSWFKDIKEEFMKSPMYGATMFSNFVNSATRGFIKGQLSIFSMPSGSGKSTIGISTLCKICCDELWDYNKNEFTTNPCYENVGSLFLEYEMDARYECTPKFISTISGVPTNHILNGVYDDGEEDRVDTAIEILDRSNIHIVVMPSFTVSLIETYIRDYRLNHNCQYVIFDYISEQASVSSDIAKKNGVTTRSDMVLSTIASTLKDIAMDTDTAIMTFTQCNSNLGTQEYMDAGVIAGSRAVQNKADIAGVLMPLRPKEEKLLDTFMTSDKFRGFGLLKPNRILHLYKVRFGSEEQGIKIWMHLDLSNGHIIDLFVTDRDNKPYALKPIGLKNKNIGE